MKPKLYVSYGEMPPMTCPACSGLLTGATGFSGHGLCKPANGTVTLCDHCFTWLTFQTYVFPKPTMTLRRATPDEIEGVDPAYRDLAMQFGLFRHRDDAKH